MNDLTLNIVAKRRKHLARYNLWDLPKADDIDGWSQQFTSPEDQKIAMISLDSLIVRSRDSAKSSIFYMLCSVLPNVIDCRTHLRKNLGAISYDILGNSNYVNQFRIQRLERPTKNPGGGQSSDNIIRDLKYIFAVNENYFKKPNKEIPHVLLVDEFSGSGKQAQTAIKDWRNHLHDNTNISVFFIAAHERGMNVLRNAFPRIRFYAAEILGDESCLLYNLKRTFNLGSTNQSKEKLKLFTKKNFVPERERPILGYKEMSLCFKPPYTACNNMAGVYLLRTKRNGVRLFERGL